jgi:hypothetical protein
MAAGPSPAHWSYDPDLGGYSDDLFFQQLWQQGSGAEKAFGMAPWLSAGPWRPEDGKAGPMVFKIVMEESWRTDIATLVN